MPTLTAKKKARQKNRDLWEVAVALPLFHTLTYRLPDPLKESAQVGCPVRVPVGRRQVTGYLLGPAREVPDVPLKNIQEVLDPLPRFGPEMLPLFRWLAEYYHYPLGEALRQIIPGGSRPPAPRRERWAVFGGGGQGPETNEFRVSSFEFQEKLNGSTRNSELKTQNFSPGPPLKTTSLRRLSPKALAILDYLREAGAAPVRELNRLFPRCQAILERLEKRGLISLPSRLSLRDPLEGQSFPVEQDIPPLIPDQEQARDAIIPGIRSRTFTPYLLHGVTASGKTEVYLAAAQEALAQARQVLVLLPEIALTHPVAQEFRRRFGGRVALLHSGLTEAQRLDQWRRLALGQADIVVGARSGVFAPLPRLGLLVVDEEHDPSYKNEGGLPYQARDVALYRGKLAEAAVVLVSATPAINTFYLAQEGRYQYLNLAQRVTPQALPEVQLIDLKKQRSGRGLTVISPPLAAAMDEVLSRGEQALLFLNRRGYATVVFCLFCGQVFQCQNCSVALTQHHAQDRLYCHYCGYGEALPQRCPHCQSTAIKRYGVGTEKVEAEVRRLWPTARVARLDRDTAPHSGRGLGLLEDFAAGNLDILVGTQMITKGHHFPGVTLVGVIAGDLSLFFPEFHAGERTFQLLAQVAGRAGRGEAPGRVLVQTYHPEHYVFQNVKTQDYQNFYASELKARRELGYPPFTRLALVRLSGTSQDTVARQAQRLADHLKSALRRRSDLHSLVRVLGPAPAGLTKLKGRFRWQLLLKSYGRQPLLQTIQHLRRAWTPPPKTKIDLTLDIDPANLF